MYRFKFLVLIVGLTLVACGDDSQDNQNNLNNQNTPECGNGEVEDGEACDNGAANSDSEVDACRTDCRVAYCGDGVVDSEEVCDGADLQGVGCSDLQDFNRGTLACSPTCELDTSGCHECGDGVVQGDEVCDGTDFGGATCASLGQLPAGELSCTADCLIETTGCHLCGNGTIEGPEECDINALGGATCDSLGQPPDGTLSCGLDCTYDVSECPSCDTAWDLIQNTGCLPSDRCTLIGTVPGCLPAGMIPAYQECGPGMGECQSGICAQGSNLPPLCAPFCESGSGTGCPGNGICAFDTPVEPVGADNEWVGVCWEPVTCDLVTDAGCETGYACRPLHGTETFCVLAGAGTLGAACYNHYDCGGGLACHIDMCVALCYSTTACSAGTCVIPFDDYPDHQDVGICVIPTP